MNEAKMSRTRVYAHNDEQKKEFVEWPFRVANAAHDSGFGLAGQHHAAPKHKPDMSEAFDYSLGDVAV